MKHDDWNNRGLLGELGHLFKRMSEEAIVIAFCLAVYALAIFKQTSIPHAFWLTFSSLAVYLTLRLLAMRHRQ